MEDCPIRFAFFLTLCIYYIINSHNFQILTMQYTLKRAAGLCRNRGQVGKEKKEKPPARGGRINTDYSLRFLAICDTLSILTISFAFAVIVYFPPQLRLISAFVSTASL